MRTVLKLSLAHSTPEEAIEHLEWIVERLKTYPHQDRQGEFHYSYTYPVIEPVEEERPYWYDEEHDDSDPNDDNDSYDGGD